MASLRVKLSAIVRNTNVVGEGHEYGKSEGMVFSDVHFNGTIFCDFKTECITN